MKRQGFAPDVACNQTVPTMTMFSSITRLDHVAVAVPSSAEALTRWRNALGAGFAGGTRRDGFMTSQCGYRNGGKLELIEPDPEYPPDQVYLNGFLARFGARIHHVALKIPDLDAGLDTLRRAGIEPVGINREPLFEEAYVRPADGGGLLVQLLATAVADHEWENDYDMEIAAPSRNGADLLAVQLRHPDPEAAASLWTTLGAALVSEASALKARWPDSALQVRIKEGRPAGPVSLVFGNAPPFPSHPRIGPLVERAY